jgi:hypothetical protein
VSVIYSTILSNITSQSFILYVLGSFSYHCHLHVTQPWMALQVSSLYLKRVHPRHPIILSKTSSKLCNQLCDYFCDQVLRQVLCSSALPKCSIHPKNYAPILLKGCAQVCSQVTTSSATRHFTSVTNQTTKFVPRLSLR